MSRFFGTAFDSESESGSSSDEAPARPQHFLPVKSFMQSDEEEDTKRVVRSAKEKRYEELTNLIKQIRNHKKIKDMTRILTTFEDLMRAHQKAIPVILKEENGVTPRFYVRILVELEDFITSEWENKKSMSKNNSKSLATLRQKLRKYNKDYQDEINKFKETPDLADEEEEEEEKKESESEDEVDSFRKKSPSVSRAPEPKASKAMDGEDKMDDSDDSMDWGSGSEESSSSDDDTEYQNPAHRFLKVSYKADKKEGKGEKLKKKRRDEGKKVEESDGEEGWTRVEKGVSISLEKPKMFEKGTEINHQLVVKKLAEVISARGKKGTDRREQVELLHELLNISNVNDLGPAIGCKINFGIIASIFDYNPAISAAMKPDYWEKCKDKIQEQLELLISNTDITIGEHVPEDSECLDKKPYRVRGCMLSVVEKMDEEFVKMLKECDAHSTEYVDRLKDETRVCVIIEKLQTYLEATGISSELCRVYLRRIEHIYYKFDPDVFRQRRGELSEDEETSLQVMNRLTKYIYTKDTTDRLRTRAILCSIYHNALHDNWYQARDLMLMSHLQDTIHHSDPPTQILYNRAMVQLGLCAFRHGIVKDAHNALLDIQSSGRAKELLAQGLLMQVRRQQERSSEQEKVEKQRQIPFHMHINLDLLECVYLVSAMLMEIPYMAAHESDARRRMISKSFHHLLKVSERQPLVGPPESMREHVVAASKAMRNGDWMACQKFIINEKMNTKVWDLFFQADKVRSMLTRKIQEESLRTYLFTYSNVYDSISLHTLSEMFELELQTVHSILSKMIINEELMASLDEPSDSVVMHRTEPSRLQSLALQLADKVGNLVEHNERILEMKQGNYYMRGQTQGGMRGQNYQQRMDRGNFRDRQRRDKAY